MSAHNAWANKARMVWNLQTINQNTKQGVIKLRTPSSKIHLHKAANLSNLIPGFSSPLSKGTAALYRTITRYKAFFMPVILWRGVVGHLRMRRSFARSANPLHHAAQRLAALCGFYNLSKGA